MWACRFDPSGIDRRQQFERDLALGVAFPAGGGCPIKRFEDRRLGNRFQLRPVSDRVLPERCAETASQGITIGEEPRLHDLDHQKGLIVARARGPRPTVAGVQVLPDRGSRGNWTLAVDQQQQSCAGTAARQSSSETAEGLFAPAAPHDPHPAQARGFEEAAPALAEPYTKRSTVTAALYVQRDPHQRFPPSSPEVQRSPRR